MAQPTELDRPPPRNSRLRLILVVGTLLSLFVCFGVAIGGYVFYDRATRLDRSSPGVVLYQYLTSRFEDREPDRAKQFVCRSPRLKALDALQADLEEREKRFNVQFDVDMAASARTEVKGSTATVVGDLVVEYREGTMWYGEAQPWRISLVEQDGWRVCGADRL